MTAVIPDTLAATLAMVGVLEEKLAPPPALRAKARLEIELECAGEGTFTIVVDTTLPWEANLEAVFRGREPRDWVERERPGRMARETGLHAESSR